MRYSETSAILNKILILINHITFQFYQSLVTTDYIYLSKAKLIVFILKFRTIFQVFRYFSDPNMSL